VLVLAGSSVRDVEKRVEHDVFGVIVLDGGAVDPPAKFQIDSNQTPNSFQSKNDERISLNGFFLYFLYYCTHDSHNFLYLSSVSIVPFPLPIYPRFGPVILVSHSCPLG
jgi:hypothetical protein